MKGRQKILVVEDNFATRTMLEHTLELEGYDVVALASGVQGTVTNYLPIVNGVEARVPSSRIADLSTRALVFPDRAMHLQGNNYGGNLVSAYPTEVGAQSLWNGQNAGAGVTVALVDTGIADVPDVADHVVARANFTKEKSFQDTYGHGTFEAGIVAGDGTSSA